MDYKISKDIEVRFSDIDALGHVNNASFLSYMEEVRLTYMAQLFPDLNYQKDFSLFPIILGDVYCRYISPAFLGETICVYAKVAEFGTKSFTMEYALEDKKTKRLIATARTTMVMYNLKTATTQLIPDLLKERIKALEGHSIPNKTL